ncbi:MAG: hypothetical protein NT118_00735 [Lentisphaerae bacterium]|nr:hypothetical protein [Lentisphaerota bacterium]
MSFSLKLGHLATRPLDTLKFLNFELGVHPSHSTMIFIMADGARRAATSVVNRWSSVAGY